MKRYRYVQTAASLFLTAALALTTAPVYIAEYAPEKQTENQSAVQEDSGGANVTTGEKGTENSGIESAGTESAETQGAENENGELTPSGEIEAGGSARKAYGPLKAVGLGDSIAKGYSADKETAIQSYGELAAESIAGEQGREYEVVNYAKNGLDSERMNTEILTQEQILSDIREADIIFITVGSNDLLNECKDTVREILNTDTKFKCAEDALRVL